MLLDAALKFKRPVFNPLAEEDNCLFIKTWLSV